MKVQKYIMVCLIILGVATAHANKVTIREAEGKLIVNINDKLFTEYRYTGFKRPFFYPVIGPTGASMTRDWPMQDNPEDIKDHIHHKGICFKHGNVNGINFWSDQKESGNIVQESIKHSIDAQGRGVIEAQNNWVDITGKLICRDTRKFVLYADNNAYVIDYEVTVKATEVELTFVDTKEGSMSIRMPTHMTDKGSPGGNIINSEGIKDNAAWGKRAKWVYYFGKRGSPVAGTAAFDHPQNPRYPTWWHVRSYGLFAANPFGQHDFEKKSPGIGDLKVEKGNEVTFRYRLIFTTGNEVDAKIAERYQAYEAEVKQ